MSRLPFDPITWAATLLVVTHFLLDLLYLKLNLDYYGAEDDFRYGWMLFTVDVAIVALIRLAFGTIPDLANPSNAVVNPLACFSAIYVVYVAWEFLYFRDNSAEKRSPFSTAIHYGLLAVWFMACATAYAIAVTMQLPSWAAVSIVIAFLVGVTVACVELYWSVFVAISDSRVKVTPPGVS